MKILLIGANGNYAIERFYLKYLNESPGIIGELFEAQNLFLEYYNKSIFNKLLFRLGFHHIYNTINKKLKNKILEFNPKILLVFKGMELLPETIKWAKRKGIKVVNFNPDNPFIFSGWGSGNKNIKKSISLYDLHFTYNLAVKNRIESKYNIPTIILPFGFDVQEDLYIKCSNQSEIIKTCFLGNPDKERAMFIMELANCGILIDVYGNNWNKWVSHPNLITYPSVYDTDFWVTLRRYRVQLNLMRIHNLDSHNMRSFEIPGIGGIMLAPKTTEHELYFKNKREVFLYKNIRDCIKIIKEILSLTTIDASKIRKNARNYSITSGYSYKDRAKQLLTELKRL